MSIDVKVPDAGESIREVIIGRWLKAEGDTVAEDEDLVELETDKASMELPAPAAGVLGAIRVQEGEAAAIGDVIAVIEEANGNSAKQKKKPKKAPSSDEGQAGREANGSTRQERDAAQVEAKSTAAETAEEESPSNDSSEDNEPATGHSVPATPSARRELRRHGLSSKDVEPAGNRIRPEDVRRHVKEQRDAQKDPSGGDQADESSAESELEEVVPMSFLRKRIAQRLVEAQQKAALLTTFNEIDMSHVAELRNEHGEAFQQRYGVKLGYMSFFVKAVIEALKQQPELNAEIRDEDQIVYRHYHHIGIAIGLEEGLVVPVLRNAQRLSFAEIEQAIDDFAQRAKGGELAPDELQGGTFTISNGGIYGSLLSTPIVNPPESGVLGMHAIEDRPVAIDGKVEIRPMMYVALTYDHRIVDGRGAVTFLRRVKQAIEEPARMLVEV